MFSSPSDLKSFMKGVTRSSSKSYNIKDETSSKHDITCMDSTVALLYVEMFVKLHGCFISTLFSFSLPPDEIMAVLKLDNVTMGQTSWRPCSQQAWDQR